MTAFIDSPLGPMLYREEEGRVTLLQFPADGATLPETEADSPLAERTKRWLESFSDGREPEEEIPMSLRGTAFQRRVWEAAARIPYGQTLSYGELAERIGCRSARAVGAALAKNPVWILIPCHRIVGKNGALTGYAGGLARKQALLDLEKGK